MTGEAFKGSDHIQKGKNRLNQINKIIDSGDLSKSDLKTAKKLRNELREAIEQAQNTLN
jgi:hypothetical protein